jgi:hypothetical protein
MASFLSVFSSFLVGIVLVVAPWTQLWDTNYLLQPHPLLRGLLLNTFTRGAITGLGLVNLMLALLEAHEHVREGRRGA